MANGCVLRVSGLPLDLGDDELLLDKLTVHFLRRRNGGNGEVAVHYPTEERGAASLTFDRREVAERVLQRSHRLEVNRFTYPLEVKRPQVQVTQLSMPITTMLRLELFTVTDLSEVLKVLHRHNLKISRVKSREGNTQLRIEGEFQDLSRCRAEIYHLLGKTLSSRPNNASAEDLSSSLELTKNMERQPTDRSTHNVTSKPRKPNNASAGDLISSPELTKNMNRQPTDRSTHIIKSKPIKPNNASADLSSSPEVIKNMERQPTDRSTHNITSKPRQPNNTTAEDVSSSPKHPRPPAAEPSALLYNRLSFTSDPNAPGRMSRWPPETLLDKKSSGSARELTRPPGGISAIAVGGSPTPSSEMNSQLATGHHRNPTDVSVQDVNSRQEYLMTTRKQTQLREPSTVNRTSNPRDTKDTSAGDLNSSHDHAKSAVKELSAYKLTSSPRKPPDLSGTPTDHSLFTAAGDPTSGSPSVSSRTRSQMNSSPGLLTEVLVDQDVFRYVTRFEGDKLDNLRRCNVEMKTAACDGYIKVILRAKSADCPEIFYKAARELSKIFSFYQKALEAITLPDDSVLTAELETILTHHRILVSPIENSLTGPAKIQLIGPASEIYRFMQMWSAFKSDLARLGAQSQGEEPRGSQGSRGKAGKK